MRLALPTLLLAATACTSDPSVGLQLRAVLDAETQGVKLMDDAATGLAAMTDRICLFDAAQAEILREEPLGADGGELLDAMGDRGLARHHGELVTLTADGTETGRLGLDTLDAGLAGDDIVAVFASDGTCAAAWIGPDRQATAFAAPGTSCDGPVGFAVDRATGAAWIADGTVLARVDRDGTVTRHDGAAADLVAWDAATGGVIVGARGGDWVQGVTAQGTVAWSRTLDGPLHEVDALGSAGFVALMAEDARGGTLELLHSTDGSLQAAHPLPEPAGMSFSSDGRGLALVTGERVYLYDVETDVTLLDTPSVSRAGRVNAWVGPASAGSGAGATVVAGVVLALLVD